LNFGKVTDFEKVTTTDLGELSNIFTRHYDSLINEISDAAQQLAVRRLIEENLIIEGNRVPLPDKVIALKHGISSELLKKLVDSRLLRAEPNNVDGFSYEISHDTLVEPIMVSYKVRFEKERTEKERIEKLLEKRKRQRKIITILSVVALVSIIFGVFRIIIWQKEKKLQVKSETEIFDKVIQEQNFNWRGYINMLDKDNNLSYEGQKILKEIDNIDLSNNALLRIQKGIIECENLKSLNLGGNGLISLPAEIGNLTKLTSLDLRQNRLTSLPDEIGNLMNLTFLDLGDNQITDIQAVSKLENLEILNLWRNPITSLPLEIAQFKNLKVLYLSYFPKLKTPAENITEFIKAVPKKVQLSESKYKNEDNSILLIYVYPIAEEWKTLPNVEVVK